MSILQKSELGLCHFVHLWCPHHAQERVRPPSQGAFNEPLPRFPPNPPWLRLLLGSFQTWKVATLTPYHVLPLFSNIVDFVPPLLEYHLPSCLLAFNAQKTQAAISSRKPSPKPQVGCHMLPIHLLPPIVLLGGGGMLLCWFTG